ncbi:MAG: nucleotide exchange factor GrpE [Candidatus Eremiobacteraeota bacterium]|nr:nucleotide exchange factor GrpE [Candidatus Eremiobacteraeota bacterium]
MKDEAKDIPDFVTDRVAEGNGETSVTTVDLEAQLAEANAKADDNYNKFLLAMADFENYKKRIERQFGDIALAGRRSLLLKVLPVLDNLERALNYDEASDGLRGGVQQTLKGFESVLVGEGVRPVEVKGKPFDPKIAEAIGTQAAAGVADETVLEEAEKGYTLGEELLRPAKVIVAKNS